MNNRRKLMVAIGASALVAPFASFAQQQSKVWRVGFLGFNPRPDSIDSTFTGAFPRGMRELGFIEGKNLEIEWRFADGKSERLPTLAAELVQLKVDVIVTGSPPATRAAQKATTHIPIVIAAGGDPVDAGFVKSLAHPGGNITGLSNVSNDLGAKQLQMLVDMVPKLSRVVVLINPDNPFMETTIAKNILAAASRTNVTVLFQEARTRKEIENAFFQMARKKAGALIVARDPFFNQQTRHIAELATKHRLPTVAGLREYVEVGGLMSYGASLTDMFRRAATYVDKIFKGAKPGDLPIEQPTKFELFINGKTARSLGLKIPQSLLISADKVIE